MGGPGCVKGGMLDAFREKAESFSDKLLSNQLHAYERLMKDKPSDELKAKLRLLHDERIRRLEMKIDDSE